MTLTTSPSFDRIVENAEAAFQRDEDDHQELMLELDVERERDERAANSLTMATASGENVTARRAYRDADGFAPTTRISIDIGAQNVLACITLTGPEDDAIWKRVRTLAMSLALSPKNHIEDVQRGRVRLELGA